MEAYQNIFTVGIYHGLEEGNYAKLVKDVPQEHVIGAIKTRARLDGQWCIDNDLVGDNEDKMHRMIAYVADTGNILRKLKYMKENGIEETVDFVCRDLANGSKWSC